MNFFIKIETSYLPVFVYIVITIAFTSDGQFLNNDIDLNVFAATEAVDRVFWGSEYLRGNIPASDIEKLLSIVHDETRKIENSITHYKSDDGLIEKYSNYKERKENFLNYRSLIGNYPPISFKDDRLATDIEKEYFLRCYRPFSDEEKKVLEKKPKSTEETEFLDYGIDSNHHNAKERKYYRSMIKMYNIIDPKLIRSLVKARYELLQHRLNDVSVSRLISYFRRSIEPRYKDQLMLWRRNEKFGFEQKDLSLLSSDFEYRKFLNFHNDYYHGNAIYGYANRHDDPALNGYDFEVTSSRVIGKRFDQMHELSREMRKFDVYYKKMAKTDPKDLPLIDHLLDTFKLYTLEFPQSRFRADQWIGKSSVKGNLGPFMMIPKHYELKNLDEIHTKVEIDMSIERAEVAKDLTFDFKSYSKNLQKSLLSDYRFAQRYGKTPLILSLEGIDVNFFKKELRRKEKLLSLDLSGTSSRLHDEQPEFGINKDVISERRESKDESDSKKTIQDFEDVESNKLFDHVKDSFDVNYNPITSYSDETKQSEILKNAEADSIHLRQSEHNFGTGGDGDNRLSPTFYSKSKFDTITSVKIKHKHI